MKNIIIFVFILISRFASVVIRLSEYRKIGPGPIELSIFHGHPTGYDHCYMAMPRKSEHLTNKPPE
jgi:STE24 endopeptidase